MVSYGGSIAYALAKVAEGANLAYRASLSNWNDWDLAAGILLVQSAGGKVRGLDGEEIVKNKTPYLVASNTSEIHRELLSSPKRVGFGKVYKITL